MINQYIISIRAKDKEQIAKDKAMLEAADSTIAHYRNKSRQQKATIAKLRDFITKVANVPIRKNDHSLNQILLDAIKTLQETE